MTNPKHTARICRNSRQAFLLGASWGHNPEWQMPRLTHIYLGPWLLTITTNGDRR
jgi:hypothetical protein